MIVRTSSLAGEYVYIDERDPALDTPHESKMDAWREQYDRAMEQGDIASLPLKNGNRPVLWRFRHLTADEIVWIVDRVANTRAQMTGNLDIVALSLISVVGATTEQGQPFELKRAPDPTRNGFSTVDRSCLDAILRGEDGRFDGALLSRLANRVWRELSPRNG